MPRISHGHSDGMAAEIGQNVSVQILAGHQGAFVAIANVHDFYILALLTQNDRQGRNNKGSLNLVVTQRLGHLCKRGKFKRLVTNGTVPVGAGIVQKRRRKVCNNRHITHFNDLTPIPLHIQFIVRPCNQ